MKKLLFISIITISIISCGKSEYKKQLETDISNIENKIKMEKAGLLIFQNSFDSLLMLPVNKVADDELKILIYKKMEVINSDISKLELKKKELEVELLKSK